MSGAAGAVGSAVGQIARLKGCRAVGIAGGPEKCAWISGELEFDAAIDYKAQDVAKALGEAAPDGVDTYFDNVGGPVTDAVFPHLNVNSRVAICGQISQLQRCRRSGRSPLALAFHRQADTRPGFPGFRLQGSSRRSARRVGWMGGTGKAKVSRNDCRRH